MDRHWWLMQRLGGSLPIDESGDLTAGQIERYLSELAAVFDNKWYDAYRPERSDPLLLLGGLQNGTGNVVRLGEVITLTGGIRSLDEEVITRLRLPSEHRSVRYELEVAACFIQANLKVTLFHQLPNGKMPDGLVEFKDQAVYYDAHIAEEMFPPLKRWYKVQDPSLQTRQAMHNLLDKYKQLPKSGIGVLIMDTVRLLAPPDFQAAADEAGKLLRPGQRTRIAGVILANKNVERSGNIVVFPTIFLRFPEGEPYLKDMADALFRFPNRRQFA